ncbi:MAG: rhomboid family intramembrane serine protease [Gemmatimonadetes bacterium]|nr:rhomboid family intramembrane serine protease [Gemmatimonadota bacterium]
MPFRSPFSLTPWVRRILIANAVVYLLTITVFTGPWFFELFAFRPATADVQPWTFITYMFVHGGFLHLAFNLLMIFFFGPSVEERMGGGAFLRYYLLCGLGGAAVSFLLMLFVAGVGPVVGASAAALGVALAFAFYWPDAPVYLVPLPMPVKVKWLVLFLFGMDLLLGVSGARDGVAHFAHIGGFLFGFAYLKTQQLLASRVRPALPRRSEVRVLARPASEGARARVDHCSTRSQADSVQREMDRVLDKISASGLNSLTAAERRFLYDTSKQMKRE